MTYWRLGPLFLARSPPRERGSCGRNGLSDTFAKRAAYQGSGVRIYWDEDLTGYGLRTMRHVFTPEAPQVVVPIEAPFDIAFTLTPPAGWRPQAGVATRLLHIQTPGGGKPKLTEVAELKVSANGALVVELSGFGNKQPEFREPLKMAVPADGRYSVACDTGVITVLGNSGETHLKPPAGAALELVFGFDHATDVLVPPTGWALALETADAPPIDPPTPPTVPPVTPTPTPPVVPPPPPSTTPPSANATDALVADLEALLLKHAAAQGIDPLLLITLQLLVDRFRKG